uniref:ARAD1B21978p n=1 Tax=Blastobotrys adeninivorans TaxID=409370 RepID=A0A060T6T8_BLAAD
MHLFNLTLLASYLWNGGQYESAIQEPDVPVRAPLRSPMADETHAPLFNLHRELVERSSVSGDEDNAVTYLAQYLRNRNFTVELETVSEEPKRQNIYAYVGNVRDTKVLLTSHIDTVPPYIPYSVDGDRIYGRGSVDAKNCVAAMTIALSELLEDGRVGQGDVGLLFVVDEEVSAKGMQFADKHLGINSWQSVIFGEPTELKLAIGHKGVALARYRAHGKAAHSGYPELGVNANEVMIKALNRILNHKFPQSPLLGPSTVNVGHIVGGVAANVIPAEAEAEVLVRVADDLGAVTTFLRDVAGSADNLELVELYAVGPQLLDYNVPGFDSIIVKYGTDIPNLHGNFKRYLYGAGSILRAHGPEEYVTTSDLVESVDGYKQLVLHSLTN